MRSIGNWIVIVRYGEISVKGKRTRERMERILIRNIRDALLKNYIEFSHISRIPGRIIITGFADEEEAVNASKILSRVMGIVSSSPAILIKFKSLDDLILKSYSFYIDRIQGSTFAVDVRRTGIHDFTSIDVEKALGKMILSHKNIKVDLNKPDYTAYIEVRDNRAFLYDKVFHGPGGIPIGCEGRVLSLFSGGIDSPVATWMMMKRGCKVDMVLFNIGGVEQVKAVLSVAKALVNRWGYGYSPKLYVINMFPLITKILMHSPERYIVIVLRRLMVKIASYLAEKIRAKAIVTGESMGQVASQTLDNIYVINEASNLPVLRPLIGFDKQEIVDLAQRIGTYEYSIKVKEYCLLGARKVVTRCSLGEVKEIENRIGISDEDIYRSIEEAEIYDLWRIDVEAYTRPTKSSCSIR